MPWPCGPAGWASFCKAKDLWSVHMPGLWVRSQLGCMQEAADQCFSLTSMLLSLFLPPFPSLKKNLTNTHVHATHSLHGFLDFLLKSLCLSFFPCPLYLISSLSTQRSLLFFKIFLVILGPLPSHIIFKTSFSSSIKIFIGIFIGITSNVEF